MTCEHKWVFQGVVYWPDERSRPGTDAKGMHYGDRYFCERCLETVVKNDRTEGTDYRKPIPGTVPR